MTVTNPSRTTICWFTISISLLLSLCMLAYSRNEDILLNYGENIVQKFATRPAEKSVTGTTEATGVVEVWPDSMLGYKVHVHDANAKGVILGVFSMDAARRAAVRRTWGAGIKHNIVFLVGRQDGSWPEEEYEEFKDIALIDREEKWGEGIAAKARLWVQISTLLWSTKWALKTDDDSYIYYDRLVETLEATDGQYWGYWHRHASPNRDPANKYYLSLEEYPRPDFPHYLSGVGYAMDRDARLCGVEMISNTTWVAREDVCTGLLMEACGIEPTHAGDELIRVHNYNGASPTDTLVIEHGLKGKGDMDRYHEKVLLAQQKAL